MSNGINAIHVDDDLARLMPNVAKLIRSGESSSLESKGSTSMSFSGSDVKHNVDSQNQKPNGQRQGESVFREVANKFLRRGAAFKVSSRSSVLATLSSNCRVGGPSSERWKNASALGKENSKPNVQTLVQQGARRVEQQKIQMRDASQKVARKLRRLPSHSEGSNYFSVNSKMQKADKSNTASGSENLAQPAAPLTMPAAPSNSQKPEHLPNLTLKAERRKVRLYRRTMPLDLSELKAEFAEIDGEALEEEEVSMSRMSRIAPVVVSAILLDREDGKSLRSEEIQKDLSVSERKKEESNSAMARFEEAAIPTYSHTDRKEGVGTFATRVTSSKSPVQDQDVPESDPAIGNQGLLECPDDGNPPLMGQDSARLLSQGLNDLASVEAIGRTADEKTTSCQLEARAQDTRGKGASVCVELAYAEGSCIDKKDCSQTQANLVKPKAAEADENTLHLEVSVPHPSPTFKSEQKSPPTAKNPSEHEVFVDIPVQGGDFSTRDSSPTPRLRYSNRWRVIDMNKRRLAFESDSESKQNAVSRALDSDSGDVSVSTVEFKGRTNSALDDRNLHGQSSHAHAASEVEGVVERENVLPVSLAQDGNLPALEVTGEMGEDPYCFTSPSPQAGCSPKCLKIRRGKRTWANLGAPIDGGREWKEGRRVSTRIKSRPLDWWRGERMLYGRVHSTLCTLIGIKTTSPDPAWPRPKPQRGDYASSNFHVDSFVDDCHCELLRLAAQ